MPPAEQLSQVAQINVTLPKGNAKVWVDNNLMSAGSGTRRMFTSPALERGYTYSYRVRASWMENGQVVQVERAVPIVPGQTAAVDFTTVNTSQMPFAQDKRE